MCLEGAAGFQPAPRVHMSPSLSLQRRGGGAKRVSQCRCSTLYSASHSFVRLQEALCSSKASSTYGGLGCRAVAGQCRRARGGRDGLACRIRERQRAQVDMRRRVAGGRGGTERAPKLLLDPRPPNLALRRAACACKVPRCDVDDLSFCSLPPSLHHAGGNSSNNDNSESSKSICRTLEIAFRKVWLRLYTSGPDENYSQALKEFVKVCVCVCVCHAHRLKVVCEGALLPDFSLRLLTCT